MKQSYYIHGDKHGNIGNIYWCWVIHHRRKIKKKILIVDLEKYILKGYVKGGMRSKFKLQPRVWR